MIKKLFIYFIASLILAVNLYAAEPTELPIWDENDTNTISITQEQKDDGFSQKTRPASGTFNGWMRNVYKWIEWYQEKFTDIDSDISKLQAVDDIADLRAISYIPDSNDNVTVAGYYAPGDGGGSQFYWDATSTETDNGGTIIKVTAITTGRWKRLYSGRVTLKMFGSKADGTTDDSTTITNALALGVPLYATDGTYLSTNITLPSGADIIGDGENTKFLTTSSSINLFTGTSATDINLDNFIMEGTGVAGTGRLIRFTGVTDSTVKNIKFYNSSASGLQTDSTSLRNNYTNLHADTCDTGFLFGDYDSTYDNITSTTHAKNGIRFDSNNNCNMNNIIAINGTGSSPAILIFGNGGNDVENCTFNNLIAEGNPAEGIRCDIANNCNFSNFNSHNNGTTQIHLEEWNNSTMTNATANDSTAGRGVFLFNSSGSNVAGLIAKGNITEGMQIKNASNINITASKVNQNTQHGVVFNGAVSVSLSSVTAVGNSSAVPNTYDGFHVEQTDGTAGNIDIVFDETCIAGNNNVSTQDQRYGVNNVDGVSVDFRGFSPDTYSQTAGTNGLINTFADGDTTPSVQGSTISEFANTGATNISRIDGVQPGKVYYIVFNDTNTTIDFSANPNLVGNAGVNYTGKIGDTMTVWSADGSLVYCDLSKNVP